MKKTNYVAPQIECIEIEIESVLCSSEVGSSVDDMNVSPKW